MIEVEKNNLSSFIKEYISNINNIEDIEYNDILRITSFVLKKDKNYLHLEDIYINDQTSVILKNTLDKFYIDKVPLQYILGLQNFYNEEYIVNENVLIPRSDSEILVEKAIEYIFKYGLNNMLDLCSGSGCIGISILNNSNIKKCTFVDISKNALDITNKNIIHNKVKKKVLTIKSDLFDEINDKFDLIVSNPPYIKSKEINNLSEYVKKEPLIALDGGNDGLDIYRKILNNASKYLNKNSFLMLEIGFDQLEDIQAIINENSNFELIEHVKDLGNNDRVVICRFLQK